MTGHPVFDAELDAAGTRLEDCTGLEREEARRLLRRNRWTRDTDAKPKEGRR